MLVIPCKFGGPDHTYPDNWEFGGADGTHPGVDERFMPTVYIYYNDKIQPIHTTVVPLCDDEAIDRFTLVAAYGKSFNPVWLSATRVLEDGSWVTEMLPWTYDKATDMATERQT